MSTAPTLVLVDGSSYLYRAFHALPPLTNSRGEPTGAVYGVVNMLNKLVREQTPQYIAVVFDAPGRTFRDDLFAEYKAHRKPMPDELRAQVAPLMEVVEGMGLPLLRLEGVEADDVIGTLARQAARDGIRVIISTGDKDMAQLVDEHTTLVNTMTGTVLDRAGVKAKFDVYPEQIIDYLALVGDSSDNIPGVPKVGPKTAARWLNEYGTLDNLLQNAAQIPGKVGENLRANLTAIELSRKLATIDCDVKLDFRPVDLKPRSPDTDKLRELYTRLELKTLLRQLAGAGSDNFREPTAPAPGEARSAVRTAPEVRAPVIDLVLSQETLDEWVKRLEEAPSFVVDTVATSEDYMTAGLVGLSLAVQPGQAAYIPLGHRYAGAPGQLDTDYVLGRLKPLLESDDHPKVGLNLKFDAHILRQHGIELGGMRYDTMLESYVLDSVGCRHDLESMALRYLGIQPTSQESVCGKGARRIGFEQIAVETAGAYACEIVTVILKLHQVLWERLQSEPSLAALYDQIERPLLPVLMRMEQAGVLVDREMLRAQSSELAARMREIELQAHREAGAPFNLESPKQLQDILFGKLQIPVVRRTPSGQPSTAEDVLEELAPAYPLPRLILEYRGLAKLKSTYTDKLPAQINARTGRIHTCYQQAVAATGRLSSTDPNLQNIPIRTAEGRRIRKAFVAPPGHVLMAADYSQIELRIMAHLSGDAGLLEAFAKDLDIHQATAAEVLGIPLDQVSAEQRRSAKAVNFGLIYGMSAFGLARQLGIERGAAQSYIDLYFERYPGVKRFMDETRALARERGYVETVFGRRLYLPEINSRNNQLRQYAERSAINAPMQGTAADIIKKAMIAIDGWIRADRVPARLIMQVHDELVLEVAQEAAGLVRQKLHDHMCAAATLRVPLKVEVGIGSNWDEAH